MRNCIILAIGLSFAVTMLNAQGGTSGAVIPKAEQTKIYTAAGATKRGKGWTLCGEDSQSQGASIELYRDLNGDSRSEAVVIDDSTFCYGKTGAGYALVTRDAAGKWSRIDNGTGMLDFLATTGVGGWPDMRIDGPGFCFPVMRWDGKIYKLHRHEYEGKRCKPQS